MLNIDVKKAIYICCPNFLHHILNRVEKSEIGYRLAKGVFWTMAGAVISRSLMLAASVLVARMLGKTGFGELGMIRSTIGMFGVFAGFGLGLTATKHVAEFRQSDPDRAGRIIGLSGLFAMLTGGLMALGLFIFAPWLAEHTINAPHLTGVLRIGALILFVNALNGAQTGALAGFEAFKTIAHVNIFVGLLSFPILVCGAYFGGLTGAVWALVINLGVNWLLNHLALRKESRRHNIPFTFKQCSHEMPILWKFSMPAVINSLMAGPVIWGCKSMLVNKPGGYAELGAFVAAESWRMIPFFACQIIAQVNFPILSQLYSNRDGRSFKKCLFTQFYMNGFIVFLGAFIVIVLSRPIMAFYGSEFRNNTLVLVLVILSTIPMQLTAVVGVANRCIGKIWWNVLLNGCWAAVYLLVTAALIKYGALGLAWATLVAYCLQFFLAATYIVWVFRTDPKLRNDFS